MINIMNLTRNNLLNEQVGNNAFTNIIFKSGNTNLIKNHLELLDKKSIDWGINKIDLNILIDIFPDLSTSIHLIIYENLLDKNLVLIFSELNFKYLYKYLQVTTNFKLLKRLLMILNKNRYNDFYNFIMDKYELYLYILKESGNTSINNYLIKYFPLEFLKADDFYKECLIIRKLVLNFSWKNTNILISQYPQKYISEHLETDNPVTFTTLLMTLPRIEYCSLYIEYITEYSFEEMKRLVPLIYPCYIILLADCKKISYSLYLNLIPYMNNKQIEFVLENCNTELFLEIFNRLTSVHLLHSTNKLSEKKFWLSLKSVSFNKLSYFIEGTTTSHKQIFMDKILGMVSSAGILLNLAPQYQIMCFIYRETFEYIISYWSSLEPYLLTIILDVLDSKKLLRISEECNLSEWSILCDNMDKYHINDLSIEILKLTSLVRNNLDTYNLLYFCRTFERYIELNHIFTILTD
jgi:hypothetical protein